MKKTLGLVLSLVMILTAVSAFAAVPSKTTEDLVDVTTDNANVSVIVTENDSEAVTTLLNALMVNNAVPAAAAAVLPEGSTYSKVEEVATMKILGGTAEKDLVVNLKFPTSFAEKNVAVFLGVLENGAVAEWKVVEAAGKNDGSIDLTLNGELQDWLNGREFIVLVAD